MTNNTYDIDTILDGEIDDLDDLPSYITFPTGAYVINAPKGMVIKKINEKDSISFEMHIVEVLDVKAKALLEDEEMPKPGDIGNTLYMLDNEFGIGNLKKVLVAIRKAYPHLNGVRDALAASEGENFGIVVSRSPGKKGTANEDKHFMRIDTIVLQK